MRGTLPSTPFNAVNPRLSPLTRGTQREADKEQIKTRFIPASAGNTFKATTPCSRFSVYPRWRGEHDLFRPGRVRTLGLSPLARGTPKLSFCALFGCRFIPAGAGNTTTADPKPNTQSVYPRWRGEHPTSAADPQSCHGLSPLARGTRFTPRTWPAQSRFIPAGAGNTFMLASAARPFSVYPRWRGEHPETVGVFRRPSGLSPLARGTPDHRYRNRCGHRFIPAGAGNTLSSCFGESGDTVYPRWRGEHIPRSDKPKKCSGLSPLARGTRPDPNTLATLRRFIPAGAGNTKPPRIFLLW